MELVIKYNKKFNNTVCSVCKNEAELQPLVPFAAFTSKDNKFVCFRCTQKLAPHIFELLDYFYYLSKLEKYPQYDLVREDLSIFEVKFLELERIRSDKRIVLVRNLIDSGFSIEDIKAISGYKYFFGRW